MVELALKSWLAVVASLIRLNWGYFRLYTLGTYKVS